jgi:hypothetical protein
MIILYIFYYICYDYLVTFPPKVAPWRSQTLKLRPGRCIVKYVNHQDGGAFNNRDYNFCFPILKLRNLFQYQWTQTTNFNEI